MQLVRLLLLLGIGWLTKATTLAQTNSPVLDLVSRYGQLDSLAKLPTDSARIVRCLQLRRAWQQSRTKNDSVYAKLVHILGRTYMYRQQYGEAERYTREAIAINSSHSALVRPLNQANSYVNLGQILALEGQYKPALDAYARSVSIARRSTTKCSVAAMALEKQATVLYELGDYEQAIMSARQGYRYARTVSDTTMMVRNMVQETQALSKENQDFQAWARIQQAFPMARPLAPLDWANVLSLAATVSRSLGNYTDAIRYHEQAFTLNKTAQIQYGCFQTLTNLAYLYQENLHQPQKAFTYYERAETYALSPAQQAITKAFRASSILAMGKPKAALSLVRQALSLFGFRYPSLSADSSAVRVLQQKEYLLSMLKIEGEILYQLGRQTGQPAYWQQARRTFLVSDYVIDLMRWEHQGQQSKLYWRETTHSLYEKAIAICYQLNDVSGAYYFMEKSRAVLLTDNLNELGARQQLPPGLAKQEQLLNQTVSSLRWQIASEKSGTSAYNRMLADLLLAQEKSDVFVRQMEKTNPLYYRYRYDNAIRPVAEVRTWLRKHNQSLVTYFVGDSALYVLGVTPAGNRLLRQPIGDYNCGLKNWLSLLNNPTALNSQFPQFVQNGADLYQLLLAPLQLPKGRVVVSPDGFFLPFEALTRSRSAQNPDYLVHTYAFSYVYSVNRLLAEPAVAATQTQFVGIAPLRFARTQTQSALPDLPGSVESLERVGAHYFMPTLLRGSMATRSQFRALAPTATVVQLFTHADADTLRREPVIYFADSSLHLSELQTGPAFKTQLLVLSACRTGVGSHQKGEGVFSLARGFAALGVPSMLTTLWSVENQPTYTLTESFYDLLAAGETKDIALQRAKQNWLRTASRSNQLPHIWAGLILIGDPAPLRQQRLAMATLWVGGSLAGGLLLLLLVAVSYNRKRMHRDKLAQRKNSQPTGGYQAGNWKPSLN